MTVPDGQVLEAVLCFLDESPRPNILFGAPAIPLSLLERNLAVSPGSIPVDQIIGVIEPLLESLFDQPRRAKHKSLSRNGKNEEWVVFESRNENANTALIAELRLRPSAKETGNMGSSFTNDAKLGRSDRPAVSNPLGSHGSIIKGSSARPAFAKPSSRVAHEGQTRRQPPEMDDRATEAPRDSPSTLPGYPVVPPSKHRQPPATDHAIRLTQFDGNQKREKPYALLVTDSGRSKRRSFDAPPSAPLPPNTLHLDPNLPGGEYEPAPRTALLRGETGKRRGFWRGLISRKKDMRDLPVVPLGGPPQVSFMDRSGGTTEVDNVLSAYLGPDTVEKQQEDSENINVRAMLGSEGGLRQITTPRDTRSVGAFTKSRGLVDPHRDSPPPLNPASKRGDDKSTVVAYHDNEPENGRSELRKRLDAVRQEMGAQPRPPKPTDTTFSNPDKGLQSESKAPPQVSRVDDRVEPEQSVSTFATIRPPGYPSPVDQTKQVDAAPLDSRHIDVLDEVDIDEVGVAESDSQMTVDMDLEHSEPSRQSSRSSTPLTTSVDPPGRSEPYPTTFLGKTFEGLPFGPDVPAFLLVEWMHDRWQILLAELVVILALAYVVQAAGL